MAGIERDNPALKGVLPRDYARPALDKTRLGQLIGLISIKVGRRGEPRQGRARRVYEYFLSQFASAEGKKGGEFYTPRSVVKLLVEMLEPSRHKAGTGKLVQRNPTRDPVSTTSLGRFCTMSGSTKPPTRAKYALVSRRR